MNLMTETYTKAETHRDMGAEGHKSMMKSYVALCKIKISLFSTLSAATGYILAAHVIQINMLVPLTGVLFLACGACALNQYQERHPDSLMERTKSRPLPSGAISPAAALRFSVMLLAAGLLVLFGSGFPAAALLGAGAVIWYNGVYTYLKRVTAFAAVPGALIGAVPPAMGWAAGGGDLPDVKILSVCVFFFIWQVPHFWLLFLSHSEDFKKAGFPTIADRLDKEQTSRITSVWIMSTAAAGLTIPLFIISSHTIFYAVLFAACLWLIMRGIMFMRKSRNPFLFSASFDRINMYMLIVMLIINGTTLF